MQSLSWIALLYVKLNNRYDDTVVVFPYKKKMNINIMTLYVNVNIEHHCVK